MKFPAILKKDFLTLFNSKLTLIMMVLGPIVLILIVGGGLSTTSLSGLTVGVIAGDSMTKNNCIINSNLLDSNTFSNDFIEIMKNRGFTVNYESKTDCLQNLKNGERNVCIVFQKGKMDMPMTDLGYTTKQLESAGISYSLDVFLDYSKQRTVWGIINSLNSIIELYSSQIRKEIDTNINHQAEKATENIKEATGVVSSVERELTTLESMVNDFKRSYVDSSSILDDIGSAKNTLHHLHDYVHDIHNMGILGDDDFDKMIEDIDDTSFILETMSSNKKGSGTENYIDYRQLDYFEFEAIDKNLDSLNLYLDLVENDLEFLGELELDSLLHPIPVGYNDLTNDDGNYIGGNLEFIDYIYPTFLSFFIMFISLTFASTIALKENLSKGYVRSMLSKTPQRDFVFSNLLISSIIIIIEISIILLFSIFFVKLDIIGNLHLLISIVLTSVFCFAMIGILMGNIFGSFESMTLSIISLALLLMMFSSIISPIETLPFIFRKVMSFSPLIILEELLRRSLLFNAEFNQTNILNLLKLLIYSSSLFIATIFIKIRKLRNL